MVMVEIIMGGKLIELYNKVDNWLFYLDKTIVFIYIPLIILHIVVLGLCVHWNYDINLTITKR
jgi:hypothetical protein